MEQILLHFLGDYIIQNDNIGVRKKEKSLTGLYYCIFHCITYSLPFLLITNYKAIILIAICHFIIDRWNIVGYFIALKNNVWKEKPKGYEQFVQSELDVSNCGYKKERPQFMSIWLYIIQDNTFHVLFNYLIILYFK